MVEKGDDGADGKPPGNPYQDPETGLFKEGNPGGPGRPPGAVSLLSALKREIRKNPERLNKVAENLLALAEEKDHRAMKAISSLFDRLDGPVKVVVSDEREDKAKVLLLEEGSKPEDEEDDDDESDTGK